MRQVQWCTVLGTQNQVDVGHNLLISEDGCARSKETQRYRSNSWKHQKPCKARIYLGLHIRMSRTNGDLTVHAWVTTKDITTYHVASTIHSNHWGQIANCHGGDAYKRRQCGSILPIQAKIKLPNTSTSIKYHITDSHAGQSSVIRHPKKSRTIILINTIYHFLDWI